MESYPKSENKLLNVYLSNFYYSFVCDHTNTIKSSKLGNKYLLKNINITFLMFYRLQGLSLLPQLIVKEIEINLKAKFNFNQAFSNYIQHKYPEAIASFLQVNI